MAEEEMEAEEMADEASKLPILLKMSRGRPGRLSYLVRSM